MLKDHRKTPEHSQKVVAAATNYQSQSAASAQTPRSILKTQADKSSKPEKAQKQQYVKKNVEVFDLTTSSDEEEAKKNETKVKIELCGHCKSRVCHDSLFGNYCLNFILMFVNA